LGDNLLYLSFQTSFLPLGDFLGWYFKILIFVVFSCWTYFFTNEPFLGDKA